MKTHSFGGAGVELNCLDYGGERRPPLLFVHGGSAHAHWWDFTAPAFSADYHALALDQRGHGDSQWPAQWAYGTRHYVADLEAVIGGWSFGAPVLIGHSMGAHNTLLYAALNSRTLRALVVIDCAPDYPQQAVDFLRSMAERPVRSFHSLEEACAGFRLLPRGTRAAPEILRHLARLSFRSDGRGGWTHKMDRRTMIREPVNVWELLARIACPTLIIKAAHSLTLGGGVAQRMVSLLPDARMVEVEDSHHHVMLDNPRAFIAALKDFLESLS